MKALKICHFTSVHSNSDIRIFVKECSTLAQAGYVVYLVVQGESGIENGFHVIGLGKIPQRRKRRMRDYAKAIAELSDLLSESIIAYGIAGSHNPAVLYLRRLEKRIYKNADAVIFTMAGSYDSIKEQNWEKEIPRSKVHYINNGIEVEQFDYNKEHFTVQDEDLDNDNLLKVVYTGSIRRVNNLGKLLDVAKLVTNPNV